MVLITERQLVREVAERWKDQYFINETWPDGPDNEDIYKKLLAMPRWATAATVAEIIGNDSWTSIRCDECGKNVKSAMRLGEEPDYESNTVKLCLACLKKAIGLYAPAASPGGCSEG